MIGPPVILAITSQLVQSPAVTTTSCAPLAAGRPFEARGPQSGPLRLSLSLPASIHRGDPLTAALRLEDTSDQPILLLSNDNPFGLDYEVVVADLHTGNEVPKRPDYVPMITRISQETVSRACPAYQYLSLTRAYDIPAGTFVVRAMRRPTQVLNDDPLQLKKLPAVQSNSVTLTVYP